MSICISKIIECYSYSFRSFLQQPCLLNIIIIKNCNEHIFSSGIITATYLYDKLKFSVSSPKLNSHYNNYIDINWLLSNTFITYQSSFLLNTSKAIWKFCYFVKPTIKFMLHPVVTPVIVNRKISAKPQTLSSPLFPLEWSSLESLRDKS